MPNDALVVVAIWLAVYGWAFVWPVARWGLHLKSKRYNVLAWIFAVAVTVSAISHVYIWYLYASGNRDWWMATMLPQLIGIGAWIATVVAAIILWAGHESAT